MWPCRATALLANNTITSNPDRSEEHTSELQSQSNLVCRLLLEKKKDQDVAGGAVRAQPHACRGRRRESRASRPTSFVHAHVPHRRWLTGRTRSGLQPHREPRHS